MSKALKVITQTFFQNQQLLQAIKIIFLLKIFIVMLCGQIKVNSITKVKKGRLKHLSKDRLNP